MAGSKTQFEKYLEQEVQEGKGVWFPVKTGLIRRLVTRKAACDRLHPNPEDEFCNPKIGPNYSIISDYQRQFAYAMQSNRYYYSGDPIIVERIHPDGYMIVNGHHRWAAALRMGRSKIPIQIVNLMHKADVEMILRNSDHTKRVAIDLDEVIFRTETDGSLEKPLPFPFNRVYKERMRLGVPALFHFLTKMGYDIWLYSANFYSTDHILNYFRRYHVKITGVITAIEKRAKSADDSGKSMEKLITGKYTDTVHIDNQSVLQICSAKKEFREYPVSGSSDDWSKEVMDVITQIEKENAETRAAP